jgi:ribosomal protein L19E
MMQMARNDKRNGLGNKYVKAIPTKKTVVKVSATKRSKELETSRTHDSGSRKNKPFPPYPPNHLSPSRVSTVRQSISKLPTTEALNPKTIRDTMKLNMQTSESREKTVSRDSTTALDFKVGKMLSPTL